MSILKKIKEKIIKLSQTELYDDEDDYEDDDDWDEEE